MISFNDYLQQGEEISTIREQIREKRLVHALLIQGEPGTGKKTLARLISSALMCISDREVPCGVCSGCRLALSGEHPDIINIEKGKPLTTEAAKGRSTIPVDDIREMIRLLRNATNNLNQVAKKANSTGSIYGADIAAMQARQDEIWETAKEILARIATIQ